MGLAATRDQVFREGRQLGEALVDARGDKGAGAPAAGQQAFGDQAVYRLAYRDARDVEILGQVAFRRNGVVLMQLAALDGVAQVSLQLQVQRRGIILGQAANGFGKRHIWNLCSHIGSGLVEAHERPPFPDSMDFICATDRASVSRIPALT